MGPARPPNTKLQVGRGLSRRSSRPGASLPARADSSLPDGFFEGFIPGLDGQRLRRRHCRDRSTLAPRPPGPGPLREDGPDDTHSVPGRVEVAGPVNALELETGHLGDVQSGLGDPHVNERLDLESVAPRIRAAVFLHLRRGVKAEYRQVTAPENIISVAKVSVLTVVAEVEEG